MPDSLLKNTTWIDWPRDEKTNSRIDLHGDGWFGFPSTENPQCQVLIAFRPDFLPAFKRLEQDAESVLAGELPVKVVQQLYSWLVHFASYSSLHWPKARHDPVAIIALYFNVRASLV